MQRCLQDPERVDGSQAYQGKLGKSNLVRSSVVGEPSAPCCPCLVAWLDVHRRIHDKIHVE
jgi:hypothetical protein